MKPIIKQSIICILACAVLIAGCRMDGGRGSFDEDEPDFMEMVEVPGGEFTMGDDDIEPPAHQVRVASFYISKYLVTQDQFKEVMGYNNSILQGESYLPADGEIQGRRPVENVTWYDTLVFCNFLSEMEGLDLVYSVDIEGMPETDYTKWGDPPITDDRYLLSPWSNVKMVEGATGYRLPTEAEWEYAAKGGGEKNPETGEYYKYSGSDDLNTVAWFLENYGGKFTHEVGKKKPNGLGIYDMTGNVYEWCWDWLGDYTIGFADRPSGPLGGTAHVMRGGYFNINSIKLLNVGRSAYQGYIKTHYNGFRVARSLPAEETEPSEP